MISRATILIVDDEPVIRESLKLVFVGRYETIEAVNGEEALRLYAERPTTLVLLDQLMPGMDGLETLKRLKEMDPAAQVVMVTALHTVDTAVEAMKAGAADYVTKPFEVDRLRRIVERLTERVALGDENRFLKNELARAAGEPIGTASLVGDSGAMQALRERIAQVAEAGATALLTGETGTGKELVARAIYRTSPRAGRHFVPVNCAAVPESLLESELFGHEKGSFTSAHERRIGMFEYADGGVLFLDEVSSMSPAMQAKLLRVLETGEVTRVGSTRTFRVDVQVVAATNTDLKQLVAEKRFRDDLYFRLRVVELRLPALRDRIEDLSLLLRHFVQRLCLDRKRGPHGFTREAISVLASYAWPGNVRELRNLVDMISVTCKKDVVAIEDLPMDFFVQPAEASEENAEGGLRKAISIFERRYIQKALEKAGGNRTRAAETLGIHRNILLRRIDELSIAIPPED